VGGADRRREILAVAAKLFRERGYYSTSLDDIMGVIGISKPAVYYYFKAKEDILYEICLLHIRNLENGSQAIVDSDLSIKEKVSKLFENIVIQYHSNRDISEAYLRETAHLSLERRKEISGMLKRQEVLVKEHVDMGIKEGVFRAVDSVHVVRGIGGMLNWLGNWYDPDGPDDIHSIVSTYIDFIMHGLLTEGGNRV